MANGERLGAGARVTLSNRKAMHIGIPTNWMVQPEKPVMMIS